MSNFLSEAPRRRLAARGLHPLLCLSLCLLVVLFALAPSRAAAGAPERSLAQREHTAWTQRNGAPDNVSALAQTVDGWLWIGTIQGLYRFDGKRFERVQPAPPQRFPDNDVYALQADPAGGLWIGWRTGGISHLRDGTLRNWGMDEGLPRGSIWGFALDGAGVWAAGLDGLAHFDGRNWRRVGPGQGFTARKASSVFVAADGTVAVLSEQGLFLRPPGAQRFEGPVGRLDARQPFFQGRRADGSGGPIYILEQRGIRMIASLRDYERLSHPWLYRERGPVSGSMLVDRTGAVWYDDAGLHRVADPARAAAAPGRAHAAGVESFAARQMSGPIIHCLFEDRDGNIWTGTDRGIDRFRAADVVPVEGPIKEWASLAPAPGAGVLATDGERAWRIRNDQATLPLPGKSGNAMSVGPGGSLWIGGVPALERRTVDGRRVLETVALPPGFSPVGKIHALAQQGDGTLWMAAIGGGAWRYRAGRWERAAELPDAGKKTPLSMLADGRGRMWFGYIDNRIALLDGAQVRIFGKEQGLEVGKVALLAEHGAMVLAGGADGLARFDGQRFVPVTAAPAQALTGLTGAVSGPDGLWLNGAAGVVRLDPRTLEGGAAGPVRIFDEQEGLRGRTGILHVGTMMRAADGRIWVSTTAGVSWFDPASIQPEAAPDKPAVLRAQVDGQARDPRRRLELAPDPGRVSFGYAAPALATPERIRYRYRLDGYDRGWQDAGAETEASYTGLPPGDYRFVVQALNGAGVAGPASDPLFLHVEASLVQTAWFKGGCVLLGALLLWGLYRYRLHVHERRLLALAHTRQTERERIARELHDTLLQGVQGLIFVFDAAVHSEAGEPLRGKLDAALARARRLVAEARDRVHDLRAGGQDRVDLAPMLAALAQRLGQEWGREIGLEVRGKSHPVEAELAHACRRVAEEGLLNACRHAGARRIGMALAFQDDALVLVIRDDGKGIAAEVLKAGRAGHWGLAGMRERAAGAGGSLEIRAAPEQGTELRLRLPHRS